MFLSPTLAICFLNTLQILAESIARYPDFNSLAVCQKECLQPGDSGNDSSVSTYLECTAADDGCLCQKLGPGLRYVDGCVNRECSNNATDAYQAQSVLAEFCTTAASISRYTVISTSVVQAAGLSFDLIERVACS